MTGWPNGLKKFCQVRRSFAGPDEPRRTTANITKLPELVRLILIVAATTRLMPHGTAATATPQHAYLRMLNDDALVAKP